MELTGEITGAEIVIQSLIDEGVEHIFGYPGGAALHIYDALHKQEQIKHILVRHEQGATHAADGYARSTGKPGVVLVTSGPGATNTLTGIATAYMDSIPLVVITGQVASTLIGDDAFQEVDAVGVTRPVVKHSYLVKDVEKIAETIKKAFHIATSGRPGPVLVDIPKDITAQKSAYSYPKSVKMRSYSPTVKGNNRQIRKAVDHIMEAQRPVVYSGGGVVLGNGAAELVDFTRKMGFPITSTLMGLGAYPETDEQFIGMLGMHGTYEANMAMHEADLIIAIGARFDDRVTGDVNKFCPHARIVHIDIDPASISKNVPATVPIVGHSSDVLKSMMRLIDKDKRKVDAAALKQWWAQIGKWRALNTSEYDRNSKLIKPQYVIEKLYETTLGEAFVTSDVGQHQMWAAQYYPFDKPRRWINSGGLGTMGFGLPAAMGVQLAHPDATVACVTGEGSIQMCIQELSTCRQYDFPIKIVNLNNRYLGMVRQWQEFFYEERYSHSYMDALPDFVKLAEAYGHVGMLIEKPEDVEGALKEAMALKDRLVFMDFITDQTENVYPMIPAGAGHAEMVLKPACEKAGTETRELA